MAMSKFNAVITEVDGKKFHSKKEAERYQELLLLERAGEISHLQTQVRYDLIVNGEKVGTYIADFVYQDERTVSRVVEDVKGYKKGMAYSYYRLKKKLMKACYGIDILET